MQSVHARVCVVCTFGEEVHRDPTECPVELPHVKIVPSTTQHSISITHHTDLCRGSGMPLPLTCRPLLSLASALSAIAPLQSGGPLSVRAKGGGEGWGGGGAR